jgi:hypothetical protein
MLTRLVLAGVGLLIAQQALASSALERALVKLAPEERANQACVIKGLPIVKKDPRLRKADRITTSNFGPPVLDGTHLIAKGGAVRTGDHWYALSFTCELSPDLMKAQSFTFSMGKEIPKDAWEDLGLF